MFFICRLELTRHVHGLDLKSEVSNNLMSDSDSLSLLRTRTRTNPTLRTELFNKVGDGFADHGYWGRPEEMNMARPTFTLNTNAPGSDLAAETAAALVWFSILSF